MFTLSHPPLPSRSVLRRRALRDTPAFSSCSKSRRPDSRRLLPVPCLAVPSAAPLSASPQHQLRALRVGRALAGLASARLARVQLRDGGIGRGIFHNAVPRFALRNPGMSRAALVIPFRKTTFHMLKRRSQAAEFARKCFMSYVLYKTEDMDELEV